MVSEIRFFKKKMKKKKKKKKKKNGWFCIIAIHKENSIFAFNFNSICLLRTSRWRTCEKVTACKKMDENITGGVKYR